MAALPDHLLPGPVGRERLPREVMTDRQRQRALAAAVEVFAEESYAVTTVDGLVEAAGIGVGSFYSLFGGKEGCLIAAFDEILEEAREAVIEAAEGASWPEQVCSGLQGLLAWIAVEPRRAQVALIEIQTAGEEALARYEGALSEVAETLARGRDLAPGRLPGSLEITTVHGVAWLLHRRLAMGEAETILPLYEELAQLLLEPYIGEESASSLVGSNQVLAGS